PRCAMISAPARAEDMRAIARASVSIAWTTLPEGSSVASATVNVPSPQPRSAHVCGGPAESYGCAISARASAGNNYQSPMWYPESDLGSIDGGAELVCNLNPLHAR